MNQLAFDNFTKKIYIKTKKAALYDLWATKEGICSWFLKSAQYVAKNGTIRSLDEKVRPGDKYRWEWHNWDGQENGEILEADGKGFLEFSFADTCRVSISLEEKDDAILLTLKQYSIPTDDQSKMNIYSGCSTGWTFWLTNLKAYLEHGILLNETERDLTKEPMAGHIFVNM